MNEIQDGSVKCRWSSWAPGNFLFIAEHQGLEGGFELIPVQVHIFHSAIFYTFKCNIIGSRFLSIGKTMFCNSFTQVLCFTSFHLYRLSGLFTCIGFLYFYLYWLSGAATNWLPASPTTDASSGTLRFNMVRILDE